MRTGSGPHSGALPEGEGAGWGDARVRIGIVGCGLIALGASALVLARSEWINGSSFWRWGYVGEPASLGWVIVAAGVVTAVVVLAFRVHERGGRGSVALGLTLLAVAAGILRLSGAWLFEQDVSLGYIDYVVRDPIVGSYYTVAEQWGGQPDFIARFPERMEEMPLHAMNKPPGPALLNLLFIHLFGNEGPPPLGYTAGLVGLFCGLLSLACIPLLYAFVRVLGGTARAGFHAAALWSLCPGAAIFFPLFDPLLTVPVLAMAVTWTLAMRDDRARWSVAMGAVFALTLFLTFNVLPIGLFLLVLGWFASGEAPGSRAVRFVRHAAIVFGVAAAIQVLLALTVGYNLPATIGAALANQAVLLEIIPRPYPATIWWDLVDYALGVAWLPVLLAAIHVTRIRRPLRLIDIAVLAGLGQLLVTAVSALLPGETARVWNFLIPLILIPAAVELARWPRWWPAAAYASMAFLTALLARSMIFMYAG